MILDHSKIQYADRLTLMYVPPYRPQLNLIEGLWGMVKNRHDQQCFFSNGSSNKISCYSVY
ncbi:transposase [Fusibacter sp. 3D3]|uniref:transposase n=1 Tax=Fusibacter sp. 3D3 TaxID=1048380 RepID=UPI000A040846